jgi:predicted Abi (CAAX) family protease
MTAAAPVPAPPKLPSLSGRTDAWTDIALTMPIFLAYHTMVPFLPLRNGADFVTSRLAGIAEHSIPAYVGLTAALAAVACGLLVAFGHREKLRLRNFVLVAIEGVLYAAAMRLVAGYVVGALHLANGEAPMGMGLFSSIAMSLGAGVYEELAFRVVLFGLGAKLILTMDDFKPALIYPAWAVVSAVVFSGWHHTGSMGEPFALQPFVFRVVCGLVFTIIYSYRGFAPAVWTHALYDIWVLVL